MMERFTARASALLCILALAACADQPTGPEEAQLTVSGPALDVADAPAQHLVVFNGQEEQFASAVAAAGGELVFSHSIGVAVVSGLDADGVATLASSGSVQSVDVQPRFELIEPATTQAPEPASALASPSNPAGAFFFARQWHMRAVSADAAWAAGRLGSADVTVAILDTGIDYLNLDLAGLVDLDRSISLMPNDDALAASVFPTRHPITDLHYHGTHVAATVASNGLVGAGVTSGTTLMGVKVCSVFGGCGNVEQGILYAVDAGADVINMSLGFTDPINKRDFPGIASAFNRIFNYAKQQGTTIVVSAGNAARDLQHEGDGWALYCEASQVVCVSATGPTASEGVNGPWTDVDAPAGYTNYGRGSITVAAPGGTSPGVVWAACSQTSLVIPVCQTGNFILGLGGTSMAAPHVSGLAALLVEDHGASPSKVRAALSKGADAIGGGHTAYYGAGRINVASSLGLN